MDVRSVLKDIPEYGNALGDARVCIAVLDGPADLSHPCFDGARLRRLNTLVQEPAGDGPMATHGTHVTSLLFGQPGTAVEGIAPRSRGLLLPVFRDAHAGHVPQIDLARAIERAIDEGAHIINISGGEKSADGNPDSILGRALQHCADEKVLVVAAVGNDGCDCLQAPAAAPSVLAVGATDESGEPLSSNNWGSAYQSNGILAPGKDIVGASPGGGRIALSGSSFATPIVAGVAALLVAQQLARGLPADPLAAGASVLQAARHPSCSPEDAPQCRQHLAGHLDAPAAYRLVLTSQPQPHPEDSQPALTHSAPGSVRSSGTPAFRPGAIATSTPLPSKAPQSAWNEGVHAMDNNEASMDFGAQSDPSASNPSPTNAASVPPPPAQPPAGPPPAGTTPSSSPTVEAAQPAQTAVEAEADLPPAPPPPALPPRMATPAPATPSRSMQHPAFGVRPSCGCGGNPAEGCHCSGASPSSERQLVYAIGTIGFDFRTEARRDSFRQLMPWPSPPRREGEREREVQPHVHDPRQIYDYLARNPWDSDKLTWTLNMDATPVYALEAETPVGMDWHEPSLPPLEPKATSQRLAKQTKEAKEPTTSEARLERLLEAMSHPPVSRVYKIFRDAILGQSLIKDDPNYISRVSVPGVLTDRTVRLFSGQVVPVVEVKSRGLNSWNETLLVNAVVEAVLQDNKQQKTPIEMTEDRKDELRITIRALLDKVYWEFRNLGQSSADRALNAAGTNAFLFGSEFKEGILSAQHVPGKDTNFYTLDSARVQKSPYCRPGSDCQDVILNFFDPENERRARVSYLFTFDVSDEYPVSLAPTHKFIGGI